MRPTPATRRYVSSRRRLLAGLACLSLLCGVAAAALGWHVQSTPEDRTPVPLAVAEVLTVGERVAFVGDLVVHGSPPAGERPAAEELGCAVTAGGGTPSVEAAGGQERIVVDGRGLVPLVAWPGREGYGFACSGPAAAAAAPLFVVPAANNRSLIPLGAYSVAVLCVPLGAVGLLMLRASSD